MPKHKKIRKAPPDLAWLGTARLYTDYAAPDFAGNLHIVEGVFQHGDFASPKEIAKIGESAYKNCKREAKRIKEELKEKYGIKSTYSQSDKSLFVHDDREGEVVIAIGVSLLVNFDSKKQAKKVYSEMGFVPANWTV